MMLVLKIGFILLLWVGSIWWYFHWKFKKERNRLTPERADF